MYHNSFYFFVFLCHSGSCICEIRSLYHKNLITFSSYMASFFSGDFYFLHAYAIIIPLYIWFIFLGWWLLKLAALSADTRHDTNISAANTRQCFVLLCYLLPFTYFREESIFLHRSDFVIWVVLLFFVFFYFSGLQIFCIVWESFAFSKY